MGSRVERVVTPTAAGMAAYEQLYQEYMKLHDLFGRGGNDVMKVLKRLQALTK